VDGRPNRRNKAAFFKFLRRSAGGPISLVDRIMLMMMTMGRDECGRGLSVKTWQKC